VVAVLTLLLALPIGLAFRGRLAANTTYAVVYLWAFVFQSVYLLLEYAGGSDEAFGDGGFPLAYGVVTAAVFLVGLGLVELGQRIRGRRAQDSARSPRTGTSASAASGNRAASANVVE
jgi:hypothetical protein